MSASEERTARPAIGGETKRLGRGAAILAAGVATSGTLTFCFFFVASHELSPSLYGGVSLLWAAVFITASVLYRPVEQLLARTLAARRALGQTGMAPLRVAGLIQLSLAAAFAIVVLLLRRQITDGLFNGADALFWIMLVAVLAYAASYFARGYLAGHHRFGLYGLLMALESASRFAFPVAVLAGLATGQTAIAIGIAAAPVLSLSVLPWAIGRHAARSLAAPARNGPRPGIDRGPPVAAAGAGQAGRIRPTTGVGEISLSKGTGFAAAVLAMMLAEQVFMNGGILAAKAIAAVDGAAVAGFVFNIMLIARAPLVVFQAVSTTLLPHLTRLRLTHGHDPFHESVQVTLMAVAGFAAVVAAVMAAAGPDIMLLLFGDKGFHYGRGGLVMVAAGMGFYLAAVTLNQAALAQGRARRAAFWWGVSAAAFIAWIFVPAFSSIVTRVEVGFLGSSALLAASLYVVYRRHPSEEPDLPEPGAPAEVEAPAAAFDEAT